jgi:hypothetical protein
MKLTQPTKSSKEWEKKHAEHVAEFKALAEKRAVPVPAYIHSPAFEAGARAVLRDGSK